MYPHLLDEAEQVLGRVIKFVNAYTKIEGKNLRLIT